MENFLEKTIDIMLMVIYNVTINLIKGAFMKESERLRKENDELQAKIEQQTQQILTLINEIRTILEN